MNYERALRLWAATPAEMADDDRLAHVVGVMTMIEGEGACFKCGWVGLLLPDHRVCDMCHDEKRCPKCNGSSRTYQVVSTAAVQVQARRRSYVGFRIDGTDS